MIDSGGWLQTWLLKIGNGKYVGRDLFIEL